jgi:hypothetical protein
VSTDLGEDQITSEPDPPQPFRARIETKIKYNLFIE